MHNYYILFSIGNEWSTLHTHICHDDYYTTIFKQKYTEIVGACMDKNATVMILENISAIHSPIFVFSF